MIVNSSARIFKNVTFWKILVYIVTMSTSWLYIPIMGIQIIFFLAIKKYFNLIGTFVTMATCKVSSQNILISRYNSSISCYSLEHFTHSIMSLIAIPAFLQDGYVCNYFLLNHTPCYSDPSRRISSFPQVVDHLERIILIFLSSIWPMVI